MTARADRQTKVDELSWAELIPEFIVHRKVDNRTVLEL